MVYSKKKIYLSGKRVFRTEKKILFVIQLIKNVPEIALKLPKNHEINVQNIETSCK